MSIIILVLWCVLVAWLCHALLPPSWSAPDRRNLAIAIIVVSALAFWGLPRLGWTPDRIFHR